MRFSLPLKRPSSSGVLPTLSEKEPHFPYDNIPSEPGAIDDQSTANLMPRRPDLEPPSLKVKRVDHYYSSSSKGWKYRNSSFSPILEMRPGSDSPNDPWQGFCFGVIRKLPTNHDAENGAQPIFKVLLKSLYLLKVCQDVMQDIPGISWTAQPLEVCCHQSIVQSSNSDTLV